MPALYFKTKALAAGGVYPVEPRALRCRLPVSGDSQWWPEALQQAGSRNGGIGDSSIG